MIAKRYRLSSKDITYILRKGQKIHTPWFSIFAIPQYSSNAYHQVSPQISTKVHKRSTVRNPIRRALIDGFSWELKKIHLPYGKFLILPNKQQETKRIKAIASTAKKDIYQTIIHRIQEDLYMFTTHRWKPSATSFRKPTASFPKQSTPTKNIPQSITAS